jgi:hypothetical protein
MTKLVGSTAEHQRIVKLILKEIGSRQDVRIWQNSTGSVFNNGRKISFGLIGSADIIGLTNTGRFLAIEVKSGNAKQSHQQIKFQEMIIKFGGIYILANELQDVYIALDQLDKYS